MELVRWEINASLVRGILFGISEEVFIENGVKEYDYNLHLGLFKITLTLIYN